MSVVKEIEKVKPSKVTEKKPCKRPLSTSTPIKYDKSSNSYDKKPLQYDKPPIDYGM